MRTQVDDNQEESNLDSSLGTLIRRAISHYEARPQQADMADAVDAAFAKHEHLLIEAGTGVGKSFAYLLPAIGRIFSHREKVVVSTHTIALQEQLIEKDIPALAAVFEKPFKAVLVKGRRNYLCIRRLAQVSRRQDAIFSNPADRRLLHEIEDWSYGTSDGSLADIPFQPAPRVWQRVRSESNNCMGAKCEFFGKCFYQQARREVEGADLLVLNHALFFADLALRQQNVTFLPDYDYVVFDEAHNIESVASNHFGLSVSSVQVRFLLNGLFNERTGRGFLGMLECSDVIECVADAGSRADALFEALVGQYNLQRGTARIPNRKRGEGDRSEGKQAEDDKTVEAVEGVPNLLSPALRELANQLKQLRGQFDREDDQFELKSYADRCGEIAQAVDMILGQQLEDHVYWLEAGGTGSGDNGNTNKSGGTATGPRKPRFAKRGKRTDTSVSLRTAPLQIAQILREAMFERIKAVVLTSATLSTGGENGFAYVRDRLGIPEPREVYLGSPFDYAKQVTLHVETRLPEPSSPDFIDAACHKIEEYLTLTRGGAFVLFTSYRALDDAAERLKSFCEDSGITLFAQGQGLPRSQMIEQFKRTKNAVILGTDSFWQGVDVPGDALKNVIITKLPFAVPTRPLIQARIDAIRDAGGVPFMEFQLPEAVLKLKQGFGRLIRSSSDRGIVVILDKRVHTKRYGRQFIEALPPCRVEFHR